ncbi:endonuclease/exonuclease/phosphatase family protein [Leucobacter chromiiresistens]|uniref:Uncharacterized conserved protein YafD, endonuclease/exonuclease/phosphatase (EEP) superfamily n=1 Tax=Leucobacter chromiiresistens TaxID=1079994 RepID=A0A1H0Z5H2_9MICO|nr:endonuclease/exonuclease/phosphatase family protein [Leucobacter chromiiresistens]SDQ22634.1 Uncharacterized conserved protein YafD, endonuclease/exonuclease/phosphatase (EEP) superfamily [Leucobacter chromiiresistens]
MPRLPHPSRSRRPIAICGSLIGALGVLLSLVRFVDSAGSWIVPTLQAGAPWAAGAAAVGVVSVLLAPRSRTAWVCALVSAANIGAALILVAPVPPGEAATGAAAADRATVVSFNALYGNGDPAELLAEAQALDADVLLLEADHDYVARLDAAGAAQRFPYRLVSDASGGAATAMLSATPLDEVALAPEDEMRFASWAADVRIGGETVRVRAVHPVPPLDGRAEVWRDEIGALDTWVSSTPGPLVVAGDFNASAAHPVFRGLCAGPGALAGCGSIFAPPTWAPREWIPPVLPLDHVLTRELAVLDRGAFRVSGSDHRAVWATVAPVGQR